MQALRSFEQERQSRVILLIHRQESLSLLGVPLSRYIRIENLEQILRAIRLTPPNVPIDLILHTPGGVSPGHRTNRQSLDPPYSQSDGFFAPLRHQRWHNASLL